MVSFVTIIWSTAAGAALLLAIVYAFVSLNDRRARGGFGFSLAAFGLAGASFFELALMHAQTPQQWGELLQWAHVPLFIFVVGMAVFVRLYMRAGRTWLMVASIGLRTIILILDLASEPNFNFDRIDAIGQVRFLGEQVTIVTDAVTGRYQWLGLLAMLLLTAFIADAMADLWRRGTTEARRLALVVGVPALLPTLLATALTQLVFWRAVELPTLMAPPPSSSRWAQWPSK
jgi:hypothetical protein